VPKLAAGESIELPAENIREVVRDKADEPVDERQSNVDATSPRSGGHYPRFE